MRKNTEFAHEAQKVQRKITKDIASNITNFIKKNTTQYNEARLYSESRSQSIVSDKIYNDISRKITNPVNFDLVKTIRSMDKSLELKNYATGQRIDKTTAAMLTKIISQIKKLDVRILPSNYNISQAIAKRDFTPLQRAVTSINAIYAESVPKRKIEAFARGNIMSKTSSIRKPNEFNNVVDKSRLKMNLATSGTIQAHRKQGNYAMNYKQTPNRKMPAVHA
jgi:hypothetical protein